MYIYICWGFFFSNQISIFFHYLITIDDRFGLLVLISIVQIPNKFFQNLTKQWQFDNVTQTGMLDTSKLEASIRSFFSNGKYEINIYLVEIYMNQNEQIFRQVLTFWSGKVQNHVRHKRPVGNEMEGKIVAFLQVART